MNGEEQNLDPKALMRLAKSGDKDAFGKLYDLYFVPVYRYIYVRVKNREGAEDLTQAVFVKVYSSIRSFEDRNKAPLAYFFTVARNTVIDYWRKYKRVLMLEPSETLQLRDSGNAHGSAIEEKDVLDGVFKAMKKLTPEQEEVVTLKFINELSNKEIAELIGKNEDAVRQIQHRAMEKLREQLAL